MLLSWEFQLAFSKPYGQRLLHQWPGHSPNLNLFENWWRSIPFLIQFYSYFDAFHSIPFQSSHFTVSFQFWPCCLWSVITPKQIDRFWHSWCQSLAFFKLFRIHVQKQKIDQEKAKLWGVEDRCVFCAPHCKKLPKTGALWFEREAIQQKSLPRNGAL